MLVPPKMYDMKFLQANPRVQERAATLLRLRHVGTRLSWKVAQ